MKLRGLLRAIMYQDRADVYRLQKVTAEDGSDDYAEEMAPVYTALPCKLAQYGKDLMADKTARAVSVFTDLRMNCAPDAVILPNDRVVVTHMGRREEFFVTSAFLYPTHQEVGLRRRGEVGNGR